MKTTTRSAIATALLMCTGTSYAGGHGGGGDLCIPVDGTVTATVDDNCGIQDPGRWPGPAPSWVPTSSVPVCFTLKGEGKAKFNGFSGLISVFVSTPPPPGLPPVGVTPLIFPGAPTDARSNIMVFTSNAVLTGKLVTGRSGTLYTQDTGAITPYIPISPTDVQMVGQILKIVGGTGGFDGASGTIAVAGQEVGGAAFYTGEICVKNKK